MEVCTLGTTKISSGRFFAETLKGYGVTHVFYVPYVFESSMQPLSEAGIVRVLAHHEVAAAYMADGYARASHRVGVCMAQQVGAANMAAGLRDAFLASAPLLCVTGGTRPDRRFKYDYQVLEDFDLYRPVTKFNAKVETPSRLPDLLRQAFREATSGTPGPTHLELPGRTGALAEGLIDAEVVVDSQHAHVPPYRPEANAADVERAARLLAAASRPVIVAGGGVIASGAEADVVTLAERLSIPVATSCTGKGTIREDHPLSLGIVGSYGHRFVNRALRESDLVFFVGSRAGDMTTDHYTAPPAGTPVIQLDINPAEIGRIYPAEVALAGDARATIRKLADAVRPGADIASWRSHVQEMRAEWLVGSHAQRESAAVPIRPERLCREIAEFLPAGGVLVADTGHAGIWTSQMLPLSLPGHRFIRCFGTLGWALAGAMGVKCALPGSPVVSFTGDGGMYYHLGELETAARFNIPTITVVNNNSALAMVKGTYEVQKMSLEDLGRADEVYSFGHTDFAQIANDMGCLGIRVERPDDIRPALDTALTAGRPVVIDVITEMNAMPEWS
jgi:acetolactate synthase I/II/III large subunit